MIGTNGVWALGAGLAIAQMSDMFNDENNIQWGFATTLGTSVLGYGLGNFLTNQTKYTMGDVRVYNFTVPLAMLTAFAAVHAQSEDIDNRNNYAIATAIAYR